MQEQQQPATWLRVPQVAKRFGLSSGTIRNLIADGRLSAVQHTKRGVFFIRSTEADRYLAELEARTQTPPTVGDTAIEGFVQTQTFEVDGFEHVAA